MKAIKFSVAAAAALAVSAFAADGDVLKPYGQISGELGLYRISGTDGSGVDVRSYASRFGLTGAHALDGGLTAVYQVEVGFNPVNGTVAADSRTGADSALGYSAGENDSTVATRNSFVGVAGGFGTFLIGNHDTPYKLAARGAGAISNADTVANLQLQTDRRLKGAVAYVAPADAVGGATIAAAIVPAHTTDDKGDPQNNFSYSLGVVVPVDIITIGAGVEIANVSIDEGTATALGDVKLAGDEITETSFFVGVNAKLADQFTIGVAYEGVSDNDKIVAKKGKYSTILVPFTADLGDGLYANAGVRYTTVDKKGAPLAAGYGVVTKADENQIDVGLAVGKKWGKDLDAYVGLKFTKTSEKVASLGNASDPADTGLDFAVGLKVAFN
jgi:predicted porin